MTKHTHSRRLLRQQQVTEITGYPRSTIYALISQGKFPRPVKIGARAVAWPEYEVIAHIDGLVAARDGGEAA
ncbi:MAG: AlpA family phage regulatory protein [Alphaproteobacteria bacterium]|jgi:prophage regulatory protein|nr:AlpA family phage regulatory protein [Alphaproteobacteria bacterium]